MRYFLASDNDGHWYVVPVCHTQDWEAWCALDGDDPRAWNTPEWAIRVGGAPSLVTFTNPQVG